MASRFFGLVGASATHALSCSGSHAAERHPALFDSPPCTENVPEVMHVCIFIQVYLNCDMGRQHYGGQCDCVEHSTWGRLAHIAVWQLGARALLDSELKNTGGATYEVR